MSVTLYQTFTPTNGLNKVFNGARSTQSCEIVNDSDYTVLVAVGGNSAPSSSTSADLMIAPRSAAVFRCLWGNIGLICTTNPSAPSTDSNTTAFSQLTPALASGLVTVRMVDEALTPSRTTLGGASVAVSDAPVGQSLPLGLDGTSGTGDTTIPQFDVGGWGALRVYFTNKHDASLAIGNEVMRLQITLEIGPPFGTTISQPYNMLIAPGRTEMCQIPLPFTNSGLSGNPAINCTFIVRTNRSSGASGDWTVLPMLVQSQVYIAPNHEGYKRESYDNAGGIAFIAGSATQIVAGPIWLMGVELGLQTMVAGVSNQAVYTMDAALNIFDTHIMRGWTSNANGLQQERRFGPVPFAAAKWIPSGFGVYYNPQVTVQGTVWTEFTR